MGTAENEAGALRSTHRLLVGVDSRVTLAFEVAAMKGISPDIVARARQFHALLLDPETRSQTLPVYDDHHRGTADCNAGGDALDDYGNRTINSSVGVDSAHSGHFVEDAGGDCDLTALPRAQRAVCNHTLKELVGTLERVALECGTKSASVVELGLYEVPGAALAASSVVYVLVSKVGAIRVGETDDLTTRLHTHRNSDQAWVDTFVLKVSDKSTARRIETAALVALRKNGWPLANESDARHTAFGSELK